MTDNLLAKIPVITQAILRAQPLDFHTRKLDELEVLHLLADKMKASIEIKNDIGEAQVRIYRDAGQRLSSQFRRGGNGSNQYTKRAKHERKRLADFGYTDKIANMCRKIAVLPDDLFEDLILGIRTSEHITYDEITARFFRQAGEIHLMRMRGISTDRPYSPSQTIAISATDMVAAAATIRADLDTAQITQLIIELQREMSNDGNNEYATHNL